MKKTLCILSIILALLMSVSAISVFADGDVSTDDGSGNAASSDDDYDAYVDDDDYFTDDDTEIGVLNKTSIELKAGESDLIEYYPAGHSLDDECIRVADKKIAKVGKLITSDGSVEKFYVYGLRKGTTTVTCYDTNLTKYTCEVKVTTSPKLKIGKKPFNSKKTYTIKRGKTLTVKISGKSSAVKNAYSSTKKSVVKVVSKKTAKKIKIKGYKAGKAKVTVKVNGVAFKIKVKVK